MYSQIQQKVVVNVTSSVRTDLRLWIYAILVVGVEFHERAAQYLQDLQSVGHNLISGCHKFSNNNGNNIQTVRHQVICRL
jgi:hypothetical protein